MTFTSHGTCALTSLCTCLAVIACTDPPREMSLDSPGLLVGAEEAAAAMVPASSGPDEAPSLPDGEPGWSLASDMPGNWSGLWFLNGSTGFATMHIGQNPLPGLYRTDDTGRTWSRVDFPQAGPLSGITGAPGETLWIHGDHREPGDDPNFFEIIGQMVASSDDGGRSWTVRRAFGPGSPVYGTAFAAGTAWVLVEGRLFRSTDGGEAWESNIPVEQGGLFGAHLRDDRNGWVVGSVSERGRPAGFVAASDDGGASWTTQIHGLEGAVNAIAEDPSERLWVVGQNGLVLRSDDGTNWEAVELGATQRLQGVGFQGSRGFIFGMGQTFLSSDGGETWEVQDDLDGVWVSAIYFVDEDNGWLASSENLILRYRAP